MSSFSSACRRLGMALAATVFLSTTATQAQLSIARTRASESQPAVAQNSRTGDFLVAYVSDVSGKPETRVRLFDSKGRAIGDEQSPFGRDHEAIGQPAVAYSYGQDRFMVATRGLFQQQAGVATMHLYPDGHSTGWGYIFFQDANGPVRIAHNSLLDEFLVTWQASYRIPGCPSPTPCQPAIWGARISPTLPTVPFVLTDTGPNVQTHAIEHVPVADLTIPQFYGGRYFLAVGTSSLIMIDTELDPYPTLWRQGAPAAPGVPLNHGAPEGNHGDIELAYGQLNGKHRLLVVWSDSDNCWPHLASCPDPEDQWSGIWGTFVDPLRLRYDETNGPQDNTPFPISMIWSHLPNTHLSTPRVSYEGTSDSFQVAWREIPFEHPYNQESRSHVRTGTVDTYVPDGLYGSSQVPVPKPNRVLSPVSGSCIPGLPCYSIEDPSHPALAARQTPGAASLARTLVVWQQRRPGNPNNLDIMGDFLLACDAILCDDFETGSLSAWSQVAP